MPEVSLLREQLAAVPDQPGVYVYRDADERVLYVGKAKSLRRRVLSYFQAPLTAPEPGAGADPMAARTGQHPKIDDMVARIASLETIVTATEAEALILEANLVKRHRPPFNVKLRDDKSYPYIAISLDEAYPRVYFTREQHRRDRLYFGPFSSASKVRETLSMIGRIFPSRPCEGPEPGRPSGVPCLDYHIKRCLAPCVGYISQEDYRALIDQIIAFLSGRYRGLEDELEAQMRAAAAAQEYEQAAVYRKLGRKVPVEPQSVEMAQYFWYFDSGKASRELGFSPRDPADTLRDTVKYIRDHLLGSSALSGVNVPALANG